MSKSLTINSFIFSEWSHIYATTKKAKNNNRKTPTSNHQTNKRKHQKKPQTNLLICWNKRADMQRYFLKLVSSIGESWHFHRSSIYLFLNFKTYKETIVSKSSKVASLFFANNFKDLFVVHRCESYFMYAHEECLTDLLNSSCLFQLYHLCRFVTFFSI